MVVKLARESPHTVKLSKSWKYIHIESVSQFLLHCYSYMLLLHFMSILNLANWNVSVYELRMLKLNHSRLHYIMHLQMYKYDNSNPISINSRLWVGYGWLHNSFKSIANLLTIKAALIIIFISTIHERTITLNVFLFWQSHREYHPIFKFPSIEHLASFGSLF